MRTHRAQENDDPRRETIEVSRAVDKRWWYKAGTVATTFRAPILIMPRALSYTWCPGQVLAPPSVP